MLLLIDVEREKRSGWSLNESTCSEYSLLITHLSFHVGTHCVCVCVGGLLAVADWQGHFCANFLELAASALINLASGWTCFCPSVRSSFLQETQLRLDDRAHLHPRSHLCQPSPWQQWTKLCTKEIESSNSGRSDRSRAEQISAPAHGGEGGGGGGGGWGIRYVVFELKIVSKRPVRGAIKVLTSVFVPGLCLQPPQLG